MTEPVLRTTLLQQPLPDPVVSAVEIRRITLQPGVVGGPHRHNGDVFGAIEQGAAILQVHGGVETLLLPGDVFHEPADTLIDRFDATAEGVTFLGCFLTGPGREPVLTPEPRS